MSAEDDQIRIDLSSDVSEGEKARQKLQEIEQQTGASAAAMGRANEASARLAAGLAEVGREAAKAAQAVKDLQEAGSGPAIAGPRVAPVVRPAAENAADAPIISHPSREAHHVASPGRIADIPDAGRAAEDVREIGRAAGAIAPEFQQARDAAGRFASGLSDAEREAHQVAAAVGTIEAAARSASSARPHIPPARAASSPVDNHTTYATARDTYDVGLPARRSIDPIEREEQAFRKLIEAMHAHEQAAPRAAAGAATVASSAASAGKAVGQAGASAARSGQMMMQLGYAADDLQYGFKGISNNIQPILSSIPALAGFSGAISIGAIAAYQLYEHWDDLAGLFGQGHVRTQAEEMEELRQKTSLTADEAERLARATALTSKVRELREGKTEEEQKTEADVGKAIVEAGSRNVAGGVLKVAPELVDSQGDAAVAKEELKKAKERLVFAEGSEDPHAIPAALEGVRQAEKDLLEARRKTAEEMAATGALPRLFPGGAGQLEDMVRKDPTAFGPKGNQLAKDLKEARRTPEDLEEEKAQAHLDASNRDYDSKLADFQNKAAEGDAKREKEQFDKEVADARRSKSYLEPSGRPAPAAPAAPPAPAGPEPPTTEKAAPGGPLRPPARPAGPASSRGEYAGVAPRMGRPGRSMPGTGKPRRPRPRPPMPPSIWPAGARPAAPKDAGPDAPKPAAPKPALPAAVAPPAPPAPLPPAAPGPGLTPAQAEAKRLDDEQAEARKRERRAFDERVDKARADKSYVGVHDEDKTPEQHRAEKLDKDAHRENLEKAEKASAGTALDERAERATIRSMLSGGSKDQISKRVEDYLARDFKSRDPGMSDEQARDAARQKAEAAFGKVGDEVHSAAMGPAKQQEGRPVERIGVADFARSVESAGSDLMKKQVDLTQQMKDQLVLLVQQGQQPARMGP